MCECFSHRDKFECQNVPNISTQIDNSFIDRTIEKTKTVDIFKYGILSII